MRTIYVDSENLCYPADTGGLTAVETEFFDGKCDTFIKGFRCEVTGSGVMFAARQSYALLAAVQAQYEQDLAEREDLEAGYYYLLEGGSASG